MKIEEMHIGQKVRDKKTKYEYILVGLGVISVGMESPYVVCDYLGNRDARYEFSPNELEDVE